MDGTGSNAGFIVALIALIALSAFFSSSETAFSAVNRLRMKALACTDKVVDMPVFRPLIGMDKLEITEKATQIGTLETSILPFEDCCTVFTPRHPATKPKMALIEKGESQLDQEALIQTAVDNAEIVEL